MSKPLEVLCLVVAGLASIGIGLGLSWLASRAIFKFGPLKIRSPRQITH